jgi:hypothetical protein
MTPGMVNVDMHHTQAKRGILCFEKLRECI